MPNLGIESVIARRRAERESLVDVARAFVRALPDSLAVRAAVVFGSVARGDFNRWSDIDVLVVAENLPAGVLARLDQLSARPARVQPVAWTPSEWRTQLARNNPIAVEASAVGVWLVGSAERLSTA